MQRCARWSFFFLWLLPASVAAQEQPPDEYEQAALDGQAAFNHGDFAEAQRLWQHARSVVPNPRIYRLLGRAADELGDHVEAVRMYRLALSAPANGLPLPDARRTEVQDVLLPQAMAHVGEILLELEPADASVTANGRPVEVQEGSLLLPVGTYTIAVRHAGYRDHSRSVEVLARARDPLRIALEREGGAAADRAQTSGSRSPDLVGPAVLLALAGAGVATFAIAGGMVLGEDASVGRECGAGFAVPTCTPEQLSTLHTLAAVADAGWITALAAGTAGFIWLAVALSESSGAEHAMRIAPWASADAGGLTLTGAL